MHQETRKASDYSREDQNRGHYQRAIRLWAHTFEKSEGSEGGLNLNFDPLARRKHLIRQDDGKHQIKPAVERKVAVQDEETKRQV